MYIPSREQRGINTIGSWGEPIGKRSAFVAIERIPIVWLRQLNYFRSASVPWIIGRLRGAFIWQIVTNGVTVVPSAVIRWSMLNNWGRFYVIMATALPINLSNFISMC